jgi:hypothetical protein
MNTKKPKKIFLMVLATVFLFSGFAPICAVSESDISKINPNAFVYILNLGIGGNTLQYRGLRNGFAVGDGQYVLTAAHCVADFENTNDILRHPMVISPYYGDIFEAEIVAIDDVNDIAVLKPTWDTHPALQLETSDDWKNSKTITIAGYPPIVKKRGGNGKNTTRSIRFETVPLVDIDGQNETTITVGPVKWAGEGWSGSALIVPETGKIAGITCVKNCGRTTNHLKLFHIVKIPITKKVWLIRGCDHHLIDTVFQKHKLTAGTFGASFPKLNRKEQFIHILDTLDVFKALNQQKVEAAMRDLCHQLPDSYLVNTLAGPAFGDPNNLSHFEHAIEIAPESTYVHAAYGNYLLARNKHPKAAMQFQCVIERDPNHVFACHGLLSALVKSDPNAAEVLGQELTARWPENAGFHFEYSKALRANHKYKKELPMIQKAIELCDGDQVPHVYQRYLADSLKANNQYEYAEQAYKKLLKTHECDHCWWAYTTLLLEMGPDRINEAQKARDKTITFVQNPNAIFEKQRFYESAIEKMLSDPNTVDGSN